jgi:hypothetical protein
MSRLCKIWESMTWVEMMAYLKNYNLMKGMQHGFVQKRSCLTNLIEFVEHVTNCVDQGYPVGVIGLLEFSEGF